MVKAVTAVATKKNEHKRTKRFHRFASDLFKGRVKPSWRKPHGLDNRARRRFKGNIRMPKSGYGTNAKTRHLLPNGFYKFVVNNAKEVELLLMHNRKYCAEIASSVSARGRKAILEKCQALGVRVTNAPAKLVKEE